MLVLCARNSGFALATWALPSQLGLGPCGLCYTLAAWALLALVAWALPLQPELWLGLCPLGLDFALVARAMCSQLGLRPHGSGFTHD
jgi:hypothetical protein